ncbi:MAG: tetratricopeptide repeat protein [Burkholderiaceae bacterium]|nr:tetratricopeptide repeat protein [Burkholderiales bacterium]MCZ8340847.1 tetratricopeptide repeat protein [Burkholderiaceae bacterium]
MSGGPRAARVGRPLLVLLGLVAALHAIALPGPFHFDDHATVAADPGAQWLVLWWRDLGLHVRPLAKLSFVATHALGERLDAVPQTHRLFGIGLHLVVLALLVALARRLAATLALGLDPRRAALAALLAAAIVGVHPLGTEAVAYVGARSMLLGTLFAVASLLAWMRFRLGDGRSWLGVAVVAALAGAASREAALVAPLAWLAWEWARDRTGSAAFSAARLRALGAWIPALALVLVALATVALLSNPRYRWLLDTSARLAAERPTAPSLAIALRYFAESLLLLRYPHIDPGPIAITPIARVGVLSGLAALLVLAWRVRASRPHLLFGLLWTALWLVPIYALPIRHDAIAERHFYPAIWGVAFPLAVEIARRAPWPPAARIALGLAALALVAVGATRLADYRSETALWEAAQRQTPTRLRVLNNLGVAYMEARRWDEAIATFERAVALHPDDALVGANLLRARERGDGPRPGPARE